MLRIMPTGDSVTAHGYRCELRDLLNAMKLDYTFVGKNIDTACPVGYEGYPGWSIKMLHFGHSNEHGSSDGIASAICNQRPDLILLLIGANDLYFSDPAVSAEHVRALLETIWATGPEIHTILSTLLPIMPGPKPWGSTVPDDVVQRVPDYNRRLRELVTKSAGEGRRISLVDAYPLVTPPEGLSPDDGVHPIGQTKHLLADMWREGIQRWLVSTGK